MFICLIAFKISGQDFVKLHWHDQKIKDTIFSSHYSLAPGITVGLERASYTVSESVEAVEICITAAGANTPCLNTQSFQVILSTTDESAGISKITIISSILICY